MVDGTLDMERNTWNKLLYLNSKATCLEVLERVKRTRNPILVTRFGQPVAEVIPPSFSSSKGRKLGSMTGTIKIKGDIISPASSADDWEALKK